MKNRFECPFIATTQSNVIKYIQNEIVLQLKPENNVKIRYFDCSYLNDNDKKSDDNEDILDEKLIMGASMKIIDIWCDGKWNKKYINAINMFEQINH